MFSVRRTELRARVNGISIIYYWNYESKALNTTLITNICAGANMTKMVTSIKVEDELWREAKIHCIRRGITLGELLERLLKEELKRAYAEEMEA